MKAKSIFIIIFSIFSTLFFALPLISVVPSALGIFLAVLMSIVPMLIALLAFKDKHLAAKSMQVVMITCTLAAVRLIISLFILMIGGFANVAGNYQLQETLSNFDNLINALTMMAVLGIIIAESIVLGIGKNFPLLGKWSNKILGIEENSQKINKDNKNNNKQENTEKIEKN